MEGKRKRYQIICPYCGKVQYAYKSIFQEMGVADAGHRDCMECGGFMKLIYNQSADVMVAEIWEIRRKGNADKRQ